MFGIEVVPSQTPSHSEHEKDMCGGNTTDALNISFIHLEGLHYRKICDKIYKNLRILLMLKYKLTTWYDIYFVGISDSKIDEMCNIMLE